MAMGTTELLVIAALLSFAMSLFGATAVSCIARVSNKLMLLGNSVAGGVLIGVSLVHMLSENTGEMDEWGKAISVSLGGEADEAFPLGYVLAGLGFFLIIGMEQLLGGHDHGEAGEKAYGDHVHEHDESDEEHESSESTDSDSEAMQRPRGSILMGLGTLIGISIHSVIESVALGASQSLGTAATLMAAILFHKTFSAFAVGSSLHGVVNNRPALWWALILVFALSAPAGILAGAMCGNALEGQRAAALQCVAGGTLLAIGITEMLVPGLSGSETQKKRRLFAAVFAFLAVSLLAIWG